MTLIRPDGLVIANYGGGVNSVTMLIVLAQQEVRPVAVLSADPGHEWPETHEYRETVMNPWLQAHGFPTVTVLSRAGEARYRKRALACGTLGDECLQKQILPSVAYPGAFKRCSLKFKAEPQRWFLERQEWAQREWLEGRKLVRAIGFDKDEARRIRFSFADPDEERRFIPWYPLYQARLSRADCIDLIRFAGLPVPRKSACTFCPNSKLTDWVELRQTHPSLFQYAVALEQNAMPTIDRPEYVGLMRCKPPGRRQLHLWQPEVACEPDEPEDSEMPCECAL